MSHRTVFAPEASCRTQMHLARRGEVTPEMARVAEREQLPVDRIRDEVARGRMVIPANVHHGALDPMAIGLHARVKINANIGSSPTTSSLDEEVEKMHLAERWGADTVMDLSTGKRIDETRESRKPTIPKPKRSTSRTCALAYPMANRRSRRTERQDARLPRRTNDGDTARRRPPRRSSRPSRARVRPRRGVAAARADGAHVARELDAGRRWWLDSWAGWKPSAEWPTPTFG